MSGAPSLVSFLKLVSGRRGHFRLESGYHSDLWLDLDPLFADARAVDPFATALSDALRPHNPSVICGPLLGGAFLAQLVARAIDAEFCFTERVAAGPGEGLFQVTYRLPRAFAKRVAGKRVAMVDDVMSAGSALRGTYAELQAHEAIPVAAGALLILGVTGADFFAQRSLAVEAPVRDRHALWTPAECPLCAAGVALEEPAWLWMNLPIP